MQDGRQQFISNVNISGTNGPIDFISTPTYTLSITTYHLDNVTSMQIHDVIMQFQDGRQKNIYNAHISGTKGPIDFISTPTCTISITTYRLDNVTSIKIDDVIMQFQDGRQKNIYNAYISGITVPIDVSSTPTVLYRLQPITWITI